MRVSLYRKFRPQLFSEIVEQKAATDMLRTSFVDGRLGQAYLFSGPRGCGKTTAARILAKVVNCMNPSGGEPCCACSSCSAVASGEHMDVMEIDGASNRGIDQIRELKSHVGLASFMGGSKVYILDEVHMLTTEAFNALLKTLEEPPARVLFIFATTEPNKVPVTIRSRCQHIPFHRISSESIAARLRDVALQEGFDADDSALWEIARNADGALRDALSLAEQAIALGNGRLSAEATRGLFGGGSRAELERFMPLLRSSPAEASSLLKELLGKGVSPERFLDALFTLFRDMWLFGLWGEDSFAGVSLSGEEKDFLKSEAPQWPVARLRRTVRACASLFPRARQGVRSDVFSGLLLFELLNAENEPDVMDERAPAPGTDIHPLPPVKSARPVMPVEVEKLAPAALTWDESPAKREELPRVGSTPVPIPETSGQEPPAGVREAFSSLWDGDLALCAAMVDASISVAGGKLVIDCSEAGPLAQATLQSPRTQAVIERAFGFVRDIPAEALAFVDSAEPALPAASQRRTNGEPGGAPTEGGAARRAHGFPGRSLEDLSAFLGADLLMSKPTGPGDTPVDDETPADDEI